MFYRVSKKIIAYARRNNILSEDKVEEYIYGLEISLSVFVSCISVIIIGFLFGMMWQSVLFLFLFILIRRFSGGLHFSSQLLCYLSMCVIGFVVLIAIKYGKNSTVCYTCIMAVSTIVLLIFSPVPAIEKPLDEKEKTVYGKIARIMTVITAVIYIILCNFGQIYIAKIISVTICAIAILEIFGKINNKRYKNKKAI